MNWIRARFMANLEDYRPIKWPPPGPFWQTGSNDDHAIVVAYLKNEKQIKEFWPEATNIDFTEEKELKFTDRFSKPEWFKS